MLAWEAVTVFAVSLAIMFRAGVCLTSSLERIGTYLRFSEGLLGIVTALGADAPEISSAFVALIFNNYEVGQAWCWGPIFSTSLVCLESAR